MNYRKLIILIIGLFSTSCFATTASYSQIDPNALLQRQPGFFRFSFDDVSMPNNTQNMGLMGFNYFADITPLIYGGVGAYGAVTGSNGGLFTLGIEAGMHYEFLPHWWGDVGMFAGGGGGRSSLVGGGR